MNKYHFIFDKTKRAKKLKKIFKKYKNFSIYKSNIVIVAGGDGFMLRTIKKYYQLKKSFYGINCGTIGFLMNKFSSSNLENRIKKTKVFNINPIEAKIVTAGKKKNKYNSSK